MPATREISVLQDGGEVGRQALDLHRLPSGEIGAKWGGLIFPVRNGDRIDLGDVAIAPSLCAPWVDQTTRWSISMGVEGDDAYLFLEGSAQTCTRTLKKLEQAGVDVLRSGPNLSGGLGDWFVRIGAPSPETTAAIREALEEATSFSEVADEQSLRERLLIQGLIAAKASQAKLKEELELAQTAAVALPDETEQQRALKQNLEAMIARLAEVQAQADAWETRALINAAPQPQTRSNRVEEVLAEAAASLLPRLDFIGDSLDFIAIEVSNRSIVWRALLELDRQERALPANWKSVSGHTGWWERHFSTGQDNQGRLYAKVHGQPARWQVLVSHKQDQAGDLRRIGQM